MLFRSITMENDFSPEERCHMPHVLEEHKEGNHQSYGWAPRDRARETLYPRYKAHFVALICIVRVAILGMYLFAI